MSKCPEYAGYNTAKARDSGRSLQPKTNIEYKPLIDMNPSNPDTIMTALVKAQKFSDYTGQEFTVFTSDPAIHKVAQKII